VFAVPVEEARDAGANDVECEVACFDDFEEVADRLCKTSCVVYEPENVDKASDDASNAARV